MKYRVISLLIVTVISATAVFAETNSYSPVKVATQESSLDGFSLNFSNPKSPQGFSLNFKPALKLLNMLIERGATVQMAVKKDQGMKVLELTVNGKRIAPIVIDSVIVFEY